MLSVSVTNLYYYLNYNNTHLMALCPGLRGWAVIRKVKPIWILLKQETVNGSGSSWAICKPAPCPRHITMLAPHHSVCTDWMPFLQPNQQRQSTEDLVKLIINKTPCPWPSAGCKDAACQIWSRSAKNCGRFQGTKNKQIDSGLHSKDILTAMLYFREHDQISHW